METLDFSVENAVGWIRLTRPEIHNPLDVPLRTDLMTVLEQVRNDPAVRVLVLNGGAGAFCAGGNLHALQEHANAGPAYWQRRINAGLRLTDDLLNVGCPVIAAIDGPAIGAGFALDVAAQVAVRCPQDFLAALLECIHDVERAA